ncbi:SNF2 family N-terminal domain protein [Penicillium chermesinum]|nr:SNF2 family N-terminal domain protein [Penicillium chermesinum]
MRTPNGSQDERGLPILVHPGVHLRATLQRLRVFVTFPALYPIYQERSDLPLTIDRLSEQGWDVRPEASWFATHLAQVVDPSPKLQALFRIIHGLGVDFGGRKEKLVILSMYPVVALIVYLAVRADFPEQHASLILSTTPNRQSLLDSFQEYDIGQVVDGWPAPGILIGTTGTLGTGVTCTRAFRLVLMEPCFMGGMSDRLLLAFGGLGSRTRARTGSD